MNFKQSEIKNVGYIKKNLDSAKDFNFYPQWETWDCVYSQVWQKRNGRQVSSDSYNQHLSGNILVDDRETGKTVLGQQSYVQQLRIN